MQARIRIKIPALPLNGEIYLKFWAASEHLTRRTPFERGVKCGGNGSQKLKGRRKKGGGSVQGEVRSSKEEVGNLRESIFELENS
jgi:hypothetical protein